MAITPKQAAMLSTSEIQSLRRLENTIDKKLREHYEGDKNKVQVSLPHRIPSRIKPVLIKLYKDQGWSVIEETSSNYSRHTTGSRLTFRAEHPIENYMAEKKPVKKQTKESLGSRAASIDIGDDNVEASQDNTGKTGSDPQPARNVEI